jgi:hypothetical protein
MVQTNVEATSTTRLQPSLYKSFYTFTWEVEAVVYHCESAKSSIRSALLQFCQRNICHRSEFQGKKDENTSFATGRKVMGLILSLYSPSENRQSGVQPMFMTEIFHTWKEIFHTWSWKEIFHTFINLKRTWLYVTWSNMINLGLFQTSNFSRVECN